MNHWVITGLLLAFAYQADAGLKIYYIRHAQSGKNVEKVWEKKDIPVLQKEILNLGEPIILPDEENPFFILGHIQKFFFTLEFHLIGFFRVGKPCGITPSSDFYGCCIHIRNMATAINRNRSSDVIIFRVNGYKIIRNDVNDR